MTAHAFERQFRHAATLSTEVADRDIVSYWLRDCDFAAVEPHFAARLVRAVMTGPAGEQFRIASEWLSTAAFAFAQNEEARAGDAGMLYETETPIACVQSMRNAP